MKLMEKLKSMKHKKLILSISFFLSVFLSAVSFSMYVTPSKVTALEYLSSFLVNGSRIEFDRAIDNTGLMKKTDFDFYMASNETRFAGNKFYYESFTYEDETNSLYLGEDIYSKVLVSSITGDNNYFDVELLYGSFPEKTMEVIVSEEVATMYGIDENTSFPHSQQVTSYYYHRPIENNILITGVFKFDENNPYLTKHDKYDHDCGKNVFISSNIDITNYKADIKNNLFGFQAVLAFGDTNRVTNSYIVQTFIDKAGSECVYVGFNDMKSITPDKEFTEALNQLDSQNPNFRHLYSNSALFLPLAIIFFTIEIITGFILIKSYKTYTKVKFGFYVIFLLALLMASIFLGVASYSIIGQTRIFFISTYSVFYYIIMMILTMALFVTIDLIVTRKNKNKTHERNTMMMEKDPKYLVSVIIPNYNGEKYVEFAVNSILKQTYGNIEIIVVDDGSTDGSVNLLRTKYGNKIKLISKENGGVSSALNTGIKNMSGNFFVWLSHDDMLTADSIEKKLNYWVDLGENENILISSKTRYINAEGNDILRFAVPGKDVNKMSHFFTATINGCSLLIPRSALENKEFPTDMKYMQDYYLWASIIRDNHQIKCLKKKITYSRIHASQVTTSKIELMEKDFARFENEYIHPLLNQNEFEQIRTIMYSMNKKKSLHPFYAKYVEEYKHYLKDNKQYDLVDSIRLMFGNLLSKSVSLARKMIKQ